jgi:hypothetical protein
MTFKFLKTVLTTCRYAMCISLTVLSLSGTASATLIESIAALEEGAMYRVLFVTSDSTLAGSSLDIDDHNTFVSNAAGTGSVTGSLGLTWKALASTNDRNAQVNTGIVNTDSSLITMFNTNGQIVASSGSDLWSSALLNPINFDEDGSRWDTTVWTGTNTNGTNRSTVDDNLATFGYSYFAFNWWVTNYFDSSTSNTIVKSLYAVSSVGTKALTDVPEPSSVILMLLGLAGLSFARYRKKP